MRDLIGVGDDAKGTLYDAGTGRSVGRIGQRGVGFEALAAATVGNVKVAHHDFQAGVAVEGDAQHLPLHPAVKALDHAVRSRRVGARLAMLHAVPLAGGLERIGGEAGAAVG